MAAPKRTRSQRVAALELPPGTLERFWESLRQAETLWRIAACMLAAIAMWGIFGGWAPPFPFRLDDIPTRNIDAKVAFDKPDPKGTEDARKKAESQIRFVYAQDLRDLRQLRDALKNVAAELGSAANLAALRPGLWDELSPPPMPGVERPTHEEQEKDFQQLHNALDSKEKLDAFNKGVDHAFVDVEQKGMLDKLDQKPDEGNQTEIWVHPRTDNLIQTLVPVAEVRGPDAIAHLHSRLKTDLASADFAERIFLWLNPKLAKLVPTLKKDVDATALNAKQARDGVKEQFVPFKRGDELAAADKPLDLDALDLLRLEYQAEVAQLTPWQKTCRTLAGLGMFAALFGLGGIYIYNRSRPILNSFRRLGTLLVMVVVTVGLCDMFSGSAWRTESGDAWRAEVIPLLLFAMTVVMAYHQELSLLLSAALALVVVVGLGQGLPEYVTLLSAVASAIFLMGRIRSRSKLIYVGLLSGAVAACTSIGVHALAGQPVNLPLGWLLLREGGRVGLWALAAGFLMTGLLPFIEKMFGVLTDISLLEIGDVAHPLLQELVRRAPGTYNHSINVASIAEAAAESIGAHALLVRVGAYFHDIGKMLKPGYFVENQGVDSNRHEALLPAMSKLIIIAHIKDGADLARQHHLPQPIIDFILEHHGTTLVEYFYRRASKQSEADPHGEEVEERSYRYPGPKPQTKEAAVMMVADAVESSSRALVEPTPGRIEGLVHEIAMKRLLDGQFDESGLTLSELQTIEESLVKSLTAVYHGRVKYPDQQTA